MTNLVQVEQKDRILFAQINRPDVKNSLTHDMYTALSDAIDLCNEKEDIKVLVLTGTADSFTAGNDVNDFAKGMPKGEPPVSRFLRTLRNSQKPVIAAVNGIAVGIGVTMLLHCDLVFASKSASFIAPFAKVGLVPEAGSSLLLPRSIGMAWANDMFLTGRALDAEEAKSVGLISRIYADDALVDETMKVATQLANSAPNAVLGTKKLVRSETQDVSARMKEEGVLFGKQLASDEFKEVVTAMFEKREPRF